MWFACVIIYSDTNTSCHWYTHTAACYQCQQYSMQPPIMALVVVYLPPSAVCPSKPLSVLAVSGISGITVLYKCVCNEVNLFGQPVSCPGDLRCIVRTTSRPTPLTLCSILHNVMQTLNNTLPHFYPFSAHLYSRNIIALS